MSYSINTCSMGITMFVLRCKTGFRKIAVLSDTTEEASCSYCSQYVNMPCTYSMVTLIGVAVFVLS
jgi:hypothetical protein